MRVWAPHAKAVDLVHDGVRTAMAAAGGGWWEVDVSGVTTYAFSLDGGPPRPDPRSASQPDGPHGPSAVVCHEAAEAVDWAGRGLDGAVIYELHVGTFAEDGTFAGVTEHLDHLVDLGVTHVELMPVAEFSGARGWGYDGVDLYAPHHAYGGPDGLKGLVDACHRRGLAVLLDVVYNHLGPSGNYLGEFGPYFTDRYDTPWGQAVNLDGPDSDEVRAFILDNARMWLRDYGIDGLRVDAVHAIFDTSAIHLLEELAGLGVIIAESDLNDPRLVRGVDRGGAGLAAQWSDDFHHALHAVLTGERTGYYGDYALLADLAAALQRGFVYDGRHAPSRRRRHGRPIPPDVAASRLLAYSQTHDQVGNRAQGERLSLLVSEGRLRMAAALVLCSPFTPMLFQGEEWGASTPFQYFTDHEDPELGKAVSDGRRRELAAFGWAPEDVPDPQDRATFDRSTLDWAELGKSPHAELLDWHRSLIALRRERRLHEGGFESVDVRYDEDGRWFVLDRAPVKVVCNLSDAALTVEGTHVAADDVVVTTA